MLTIVGALYFDIAKGQLKGFQGDNFEVGVGPLSTIFTVSKPPYQEGDQWKMIVDGVVLVRTAQ